MAHDSPIVFLPGVMGSRLYFEASGKSWDPDSSWQMLRWMPVWPFRSDDDNRRELHAGQPAGVMIDPLDSGSMDAEAVRLGWGGVVWGYYSEFLTTLRLLARDGRAFAVGYDWRQDIRWLGEYVADKLASVLDMTGAAKLSLVTHSMGGLVARAALRHDPSLIGRVSTFFTICQPAVGAVVLYRRLFTGLIPDLDGGGSIADRAFRLLLGNGRAAFVGNMSGLPGAMQLLPSEHFPADAAGLPWNASIAGAVTHNLLYADNQSPPGLIEAALGLPADALDDLTDRVAEVADFHAWLGAPIPPDPDGPEAWLAYGRGIQTEIRIAFRGIEASPTRTLDGDGTVPILSARAPGLVAGRMIEVSGLEHAKACQHRDVIDLARRIFA